MDRIADFVRGYLRSYTSYKKGWNYEDHCILVAAIDLWEATGEAEWRDYVLAYLDRYVQADGSVPAFDRNVFSTDNITPGRILFFGLKETGEERYRRAIETHMEHLRRHPRCSCGNFWHKDIYPNQVWLDGLYMAQPFYMLYEREFDRWANLQDISAQFRVVREKMYNPQKGLYYHGWDETRVQPWANPETGLSPNFWSRAMGWYLMALVDCIEICSEQLYEHRQALVEQLRSALAGLRAWQDADTGMILQVIDRPDVEGNYLETSGSAMLAYALFKGVRLGVLNPEPALALAWKTWHGIVREKLFTDGEGRTHLKDMCRVAGLGPGSKRDGSVAYYLSEERAVDEGKGVAVFTMAYTETLRAEKPEDMDA